MNQPKQTRGSFLNLNESGYLKLLDWTGRQQRQEKKDRIPDKLKPILNRMEIETETWPKTVKRFDSWLYRAAGRVENLIQAAGKLRAEGREEEKTKLALYYPRLVASATGLKSQKNKLLQKQLSQK